MRPEVPVRGGADRPQRSRARSRHQHHFADGDDGRKLQKLSKLL
jgi:hypothetical protein